MKNILLSLTISISTLIFAQKGNVNHNLNVRINPEISKIEVLDEISGEFINSFLLNAELTVESKTKGVTLTKVELDKKAPDVGMDRDDAAKESSLKLTKWEVKGAKDKFVISYSGKINSAMESSEEEYQRGFSQTSGIINSKGTYLAGSTYWVPIFENRLMTYSLSCSLPLGWANVSQGKRINNEIKDNRHVDTWLCTNPQEEVFLIAAKFTEYSYKMNSGVLAMAFLRTPDEGLANKYLEVTEQYMEMYQSMLGDYPYSKFALVENFWETGYGMPSFTLLGEKIIRFPFILHSSYPHELLHNWWGNSVYVDFESGNWCEGITVYMADHLIKEQRGAGEEYRRSTLQKFSNVVTPSNDFPLTKFLSRSDEASSAIGYGKAMMMWHMLRRQLGNELFIKGVALFNKNNKYKTASYTDMQFAFEEVSGLNLDAFFKQWTTRTSAPELEIKAIKTDMFAGKYRINLNLIQKQKSEFFNLDIPITVQTEKGLETFIFNMDKKEKEFQIQLKSKPLKLVVDPQYDVFRILDPSEVPPTLSKIWGSAQNLIVLPSKASKNQLEIYENFVQDWIKLDKDNFEIVYDNKIKQLPSNKTAWIIGFENSFASEIDNQLKDYNSAISTDSVKLGKKIIEKPNNSFVITLSKKEDVSKQNIFIAFSKKEASAGLIRKLPHYGKYSYLAFNGDEPTNIAKGQWPVLKSPLVNQFVDNAPNISINAPRTALADLKPVFSEKRIMKTVGFLASEELKGRGIGTPEINKAAEFIAQQFNEAGLKPLGKDYFQEFEHKFEGKPSMQLKNVIGIIPGTDPSLKDNPVVISAHYDHLGLGWPDVRKGNEGKIHYGADDNASGVAILIELAKTMAKSTKAKRTIIFLACTAEEAGLIGSRYFVAHKNDYVKGNFFANINLDTDGSLFDKKILVLNGNTAKEWKFIFMGTDYTTGIKSDVISQELDASDQVAFIEKNIPAIQLFTGATEHYHRPSDKIETLDSKGMVKVATVAKEVLVYLADREDPMNFTGTSQSQQSHQTNSSHKIVRKASTGSVPDFAYRGEGVKLSSVIKDSAGDKAGLKAGDIIVAFDGKKTSNLKEYSNILKQYKPKDVVVVNIIRAGHKKDIKLQLGER